MDNKQNDGKTDATRLPPCASEQAPSDQKRRDMLKLGAAGILGGILGAKILMNSSSALAQGGAAGGKLEMVKESDPQAQALGYSADAKKVNTTKWTKRAGTEGAKQFCYNCQFFQAGGKDPKSLPSAPCQILSMKGVASKGWCNTWTQNPAVKG